MIAWFTRNGVAANLVMAIIVLGGLAALLSVKRAVFPEFSLDTVAITVPFLGAAPEEVEQGVILRIEEAIQGLEGIQRITSTAREGIGTVLVEVQKGTSLERMKDRLKNSVDSINTFPEEIEEPIIEELTVARDVIRLTVYGEASERTLREIAANVRDELVKLPGLSQAQVEGGRPYEVSIEVSEDRLRQYGLTFDEVVAAVRQSSVDIPGGTLRTDNAEILLRTVNQAYVATEFTDIPLRAGRDGRSITLGEVATVVDGFADWPLIELFNGQRAQTVLVQEIGDEDVLGIAASVRTYAEELQARLPEGIDAKVWVDLSFYLQGRLDTLIKNGAMGLILVFLTLALFLRPSLAFFVALGIPLSFLGTFLLAPWTGISIDMISLFAFILVLGIVVDDAIVVGESVFSAFQKRGPGVEAAIQGAHRVAMPVTFAVLTTVVAFTPLFFLPGMIGKFFFSIPLVVIPTLLWSLVQSKLVLPYHLSLINVGDKQGRAKLNLLSRLQRAVADGLERFIERFYRPTLAWCLHWRYLTASLFIAAFILSIGMVASGVIRFVVFPKVPSDYLFLTLDMAEGTAFPRTEEVAAHLEATLDEVRAEAMAAGQVDPVADYSMLIGVSVGQDPSGSVQAGSNHITMILGLPVAEVQQMTSFEVSERWREKIGQIPGLRSMNIVAEAGGPVGLPVDVQLKGANFDDLRAAAAEIRARLHEFDGLYEIRDTFAEGKREVQLVLKPEGEALGLTTAALGSQARAAFHGQEAQRVQRGRDEVRVMVRYPADERVSLSNLENMRLRLPDGREVPFAAVAEAVDGESLPTITRIDRERVIRVQAKADQENVDMGPINKALQGEILPEVIARYPSVSPVLMGEMEDLREAQGSLILGFTLVLAMIYALLAVPFRSYLQPLIVMCVIPFGLTGAILGHFFTFQAISLLSGLGIVALTGVVVNDSLVLVDFINRARAEGRSLIDAISVAGAERFRPILLTSLTTFMGLVPMLLEQSLQAQFLIPMATSLAFGVLFATFMTLLLVPCAYLMLEDVKSVFGRFARWTPWLAWAVRN